MTEQETREAMRINDDVLAALVGKYMAATRPTTEHWSSQVIAAIEDELRRCFVR